MAFNEKISKVMIEQGVTAPARRRKLIGDTVTNFVGDLGKSEATGEPREANMLDSVKRLLGFDTGPDVIHSETLTGLGAYPWEGRQRDRNISLQRNTARARQIVLEERLRERRRADAREKAWRKKAFETMDDLGGVPEGSPSYVRGNMMTQPQMILEAVELDRQMNEPGGKRRL